MDEPGIGAATASDEISSGLEQRRDVTNKFLRRRVVDSLVADKLWQSCVGLDPNGLLCGGSEPRADSKEAFNALPAICPTTSAPRDCQLRSRLFWRYASQRTVPVFTGVEYHGHDHRQARFPRNFQGQNGFRQCRSWFR